MPNGYVLIFYWTIVALGGALFVGTGAALVRYVRTGSFPGQSADRPGDVPRSAVRRVLLRCLVGFAAASAGFAGVLTVSG